jgi:hypothetical protein
MVVISGSYVSRHCPFKTQYLWPQLPVRFWHEADVAPYVNDVGFWTQSGLDQPSDAFQSRHSRPFLVRRA